MSFTSKNFSKTLIPFIVIVFLLIGLYVYSNKKYNIYDTMTTVTSTTNEVAPSSNGTTYASNNSDPSELLPKDSNSEWASLNPISPSNVAIPDLLQSGYHIGIDTQGQTNKNPNYQGYGRDDPVIDKVDTGPWQQSTIEPHKYMHG